ncbi:Apple domain-containing protein [Madurella fahalii]|uniref:Apple domain-containing protein n=1 Tax=Madurella fahalii TaxID=1157608 RepID=A0ABQ0GM72_9PEZI
MYESGLEPARQDYPEVSAATRHGLQEPQLYPGQYQQQPQQPYHPQPYGSPPPPPKLEASHASLAPPSAYGSQTTAPPFSSNAQPAAESKSITSRTICGCSFLVFVLSCIIALLSAAVIGLAAATGIEAKRANDAANSLAALNSSATANVTPGGAVPPPPAVSVIDDGCSNDPANVDRTLYTSFPLFGGLRFTRYCNRDAPNSPLLSMFTADFDTCMDACAAYTSYLPGSFGNVENSTCEAVSFIPAWTNKTTAEAGDAPGNCYLKGGPQTEDGLNIPNIGVDCHAAILTPGA